MRYCPKCNLQFPDTSKICRSCGAILETLPDEPPAPADLPEAPPPAEIVAPACEIPARDSASFADWICTKCGESVPASFALCWNCVADGALDADDKAPSSASPSMLQEQRPQLRCAVCGSDKVIPSVQVADQGEYSDGRLNVVLYGNPDALMFKDRKWGQLTANICGACGHVQLHVQNPQALYEHYQRSKPFTDA